MAEMQHKTEGLKPHRCIKCGARLFDAFVEIGRIEIKCKCGTMNKIEASQPKR